MACRWRATAIRGEIAVVNFDLFAHIPRTYFLDWGPSLVQLNAASHCDTLYSDSDPISLQVEQTTTLSQLRVVHTPELLSVKFNGPLFGMVECRSVSKTPR
jgi:hypothetical protein